MRAEAIEADLSWSDFVIVRMLRRWTAGRAAEGNPLPGLVEMAAELGETTEAAIALHSLFQLTESCLGRHLEAECCCSRVYTQDERALITLVASVPPQALPISSQAVPHGLPGALLWAARTVRLILGGPAQAAPAQAPEVCPFEQRGCAILLRA